MLELPREERLDLLLELVESLQEPTSDVREAWIDEVKRRMDEYRAGKVEAMSWEEFEQQLVEP